LSDGAGQENEHKTADTETSSQEDSKSTVLFKEDDKNNCSATTSGKKIQLKWNNSGKVAMGFILIDSNCEAKGDFQRIEAGKTFTGSAYEGQVLYVIERIDSDENHKMHIKIDKSTAIKTFGK